MNEQKRFLEHVNGLRGVCILLVVLFHMLSTWCPLGYLGVDAFFVIAGYFLIPPMLHRMEGGTFSWGGYYSGKFRRIMPVLMVVVVVAMLLVVLLQTPQVIRSLSKHMRTALMGYSNVTFGLQAADYFSPSLKDNPFLHTWYISALIQMLAVAPLAVWLFVRRSRVLRYTVVALLMVCSGVVFFQRLLPESVMQALPAWLQDNGRMGSVYYMTLGRFWEVLAGACIVVLPAVEARFGRAFLLGVGLLAVLLSAFGLLGEHGMMPLVVVVGTMLIVRYGGDTPLDGLLTNRVFMWFGTVSFSLYLVHWVVLAIYRGILPQDCTLTELGVLAVVFLVLSWVMYRYVESPRFSLRTVLIAWGVSLALAFAVRKTPFTEYLYSVDQATMQEASREDYLDWRLPRQTPWLESYPRNLPVWGRIPLSLFRDPLSQAPEKPAVLQVGDPELEPNFVLAGDSYVGTLSPGFDIVAREQGWSGLYSPAYVSPFWGQNNNNVPEFNFNREKAEAFMSWLAANPAITYVVIHQRWMYRFRYVQTWEGKKIPEAEAMEAATNALREFCRRLKAMGKTAVLVLPTPESGAKIKYNLADTVYGQPILGPRQDVRCSWDEYMEKNGRIRERILQVEKEGLCLAVDPAPGLFSQGMFDPVDGAHLIYTDYGHMTIYGAVKIMNCIKPRLQEILGRSEPGEREPERGQPEDAALEGAH